MFVADRVARALQDEADSFRQATLESADLHRRYAEAFDTLHTLPVREIERRLAGTEWPGARPSGEMAAQGPIIPFLPRWDSAQEARSWAMERLRGVPTVAVDGSQIAASKEFAVPVSLVQVAWFVNPHVADRPYIKDVCNEIVTAGDAAGEVEQYVFAESRLNQRRFTLEMQTAVQCLSKLPTDPPPVVFVDSSLVLSFLARIFPDARPAYLRAVFALLDASRAYRIPVAGYIDLSFASDLNAMLRAMFALPNGDVFDAQILMDHLRPLDRTAAFQCARSDILPLYNSGDRDYGEELFFVYLKAGQNRLPSRIDFPRWLLDEGLLDHVLDIIRAEIIIGSGYPYALETADAAAVLTNSDRIAFYRQFHEFARSAGLETMLPAKSLSKARRR